MSLFFKRTFVFFALITWGISLSLAESIRDLATGFSMDVNVPKTTSCIVYPDKPYDADACAIDNYLFPTRDAVMIARGVVRFEPSGEMLFNIADIKAPFTAPMSQREAEVFIGKYLELFNVAEIQTLDAGMVVVNRQPFYRYYGDVGLDTALPYSRILFYTFSGKGYHYFISFNFDPSLEKKAFGASDRMLRSIKIPLPEHSARGELIYQLAHEVVFSCALFVMLFLLFSGVAWLINRWVPKNEEKPSIFSGSGALALEGLTRFFVLSILIVGIYEISVVFRSWEMLEAFLIAYAAGVTAFILLRFIWKKIALWGQWKLNEVAAESSDALFFPMGIWKLIILSIFTFGLYPFYWFYKNWTYVDRTTDKRINPALKAVFYPISAYFLFRRINQDAKNRGASLHFYAGFWAGVLVVCFLVDMIPLGNLLPEVFLFGLGLVVFTIEFMVLIPAQSVINQLNQQYAPQADLNRRFTKIDAVICFIGAVVLALIGYLLYAQ